ncbi:hypothetical protein HQ520_09240 [bacterium]|nr:hypothetical protein [bacterium]
MRAHSKAFYTLLGMAFMLVMAAASFALVKQGTDARQDAEILSNRATNTRIETKLDRIWERVSQP